MDLPGTIPLFPLPNAVLFPGVPLPLHIFEPRYRAMVRDTIEGVSGLIGMVLLRGDWRENYHESPDIFALGCAGRLLRADKLEGGRFNILLQGVREFRVDAECGDTAYRQAAVSWRDSPIDQLSDERRAELKSLAAGPHGSGRSAVTLRMLGDESLSDEVFINFLCFALDLPPIEKQALLEAAAVCQRAERLAEILRFRRSEVGQPGSGSVH